MSISSSEATVVGTEPFLGTTSEVGSQPATVYEEGWTAIREEEYYRLPDWCMALCESQAQGQLPSVTHEEVLSASDAYFSAAAPTWIAEEMQAVDNDMKVDNE